jgi:hypothetical protein
LVNSSAFAGLLVTVAQIVIAVCMLAPEGPLAYRYTTLLQHDSFWFMNIVDRGYETTVPPMDHRTIAPIEHRAHRAHSL